MRFDAETLTNTEPRAIESMVQMFDVHINSNNQMQTMAISGPAPPQMSQFSISNATVSEDGTTIRIDRMHAGLRIPISVASPQKNTEYFDSGIDQDVDVKEGQKVVVGRSSLAGPQQALFLILTARVIQ